MPFSANDITKFSNIRRASETASNAPSDLLGKHSFAVCNHGSCGKRLPLTEQYFYLKEAATASNPLRWDKVCRDCRKRIRREKYQESSSSSVKAKPAVNHPALEPRPPLQNPQPDFPAIELRKHETEVIAKGIIFSEEERILGRELAPGERYDAVQRFNEFVSILRKEYGKITGKHIYIKR